MCFGYRGKTAAKGGEWFEWCQSGSSPPRSGMGLAGLFYLVVYSLRALSAYSRMFWVMMGTAGPPEAPPDIKNGIWGTTVHEA